MTCGVSEATQLSFVEVDRGHNNDSHAGRNFPEDIHKIKTVGVRKVYIQKTDVIRGTAYFIQRIFPVPHRRYIETVMSKSRRERIEDEILVINK